MDVLRHKYTYTTKFILPLLFKDNATYHNLFTEPFINAYIADMANKDSDDKIYLLFADYPSLTFQKLLPDTISEYPFKDGYYVLVYDIPLNYREDYNKFLMGQYSQFTDSAKDQILDFWEEHDDSILVGTLYRKGNKIKEFYKKIIGEDIEHISPSAEWWAPPLIAQEILGLAD